MKKKEYIVVGDCRLSRTRVGNARTIRKENILKFWRDYPEMKKENGVYIFALTWRNSFMPYYVGKATNSFGSEIFTDNKIVRYKDIVLQYNGKPVFFFIVQQGWKNDRINRKVESFVTGMCYKRNPDIQNVQNKIEDKWYIKGVLNNKGHGKGRIPREASKLKLCLGL